MACMCKSIPSYLVTSLAIDTTTGIATLTLNTTSIPTGRFDMVFNLCCNNISPCWTETLNIVAGTTTYSNVLQRDGNFVRLGQLANQINRCHVIHANLTSSPAGNVMVLDKPSPCAFTGAVTATTAVTVDAVTTAAVTPVAPASLRSAKA